MSLAKNIQLKSSGFTTLEDNLYRQFLHKVVEPAEVTVKDTAEDIAIVAIEFAPEDTRTLVSAIGVHPNRRQGFYVSSEVTVNGSAYNRKAHKYLAEYDEYINENLTPFGAKLNLGKKSREKNPTITDGIGVGGHFMQRAVTYCVQNFIEHMIININNKLSS